MAHLYQLRRRIAALAAIALQASGTIAGAIAAPAESRDRRSNAPRTEQALRSAIAAGGDTAELHGELGLLLYGTGRFHDAIPELGRAAQLDPAFPDYSLKLAAAILAERRYGVALEFLRAVGPRFENLAEYQYNVGLAHYGMRRFDGALAAFQRAIKIDPKMDLAHFFLANCLVANANLAGAVPFYRNALQLNPNKSGYYYALGKTLGDMGPKHFREAVSLLRTALKLQPDDAASQFALGKLYERAGDAVSARPLLESAVSRYPDEIAPRVVLAKVYSRLKQPEKAKAQFAAIRRLEASRRETDSQLEPSGHSGSPATSPEPLPR